MTGAIRVRVLLLAISFTAASFVMLYAADALTVGVGTAVVLVAAVVYTLGELVAGPVLGALSAEAAPDEHRGRYMSVVQLAWNLSGAIAPLLYAALLDGGSLAMWGGAVVLCGLWAAVTVRMAAVLPRSRERVTNTAEEHAAAG